MCLASAFGSANPPDQLIRATFLDLVDVLRHAAAHVTLWKRTDDSWAARGMETSGACATGTEYLYRRRAWLPPGMYKGDVRKDRGGGTVYKDPKCGVVLRAWGSWEDGGVRR